MPTRYSVHAPLLLGLLLAACGSTQPAAPTGPRAPASDAVSGDGAVTTAAADEPRARPLRPVHTFSIVARDPDTGALGVAVQSHWFSVGSVVTWAEPGVGAVATQSFAEPAYGPRALALMRTGLSAAQTLAALISADPAEAVRQVAIVDA